MTEPAAFCHTGLYPDAPPQVFRMPQHYLLYAARGSMRLEAAGRAWLLPPARAALIAADHPATVTLTGPLEARSALFEPGACPAPAQALAVFEATPLLRELLAACAPWTRAVIARPDEAPALFDALRAHAWARAAHPSPTALPVARSAKLAEAIARLESQLADPPGLDTLARQVALSERTLARRFTQELGMGRRELLRRMRMIRAAELLADTEMPVAQVGFAVGYNALSAFNAGFARQFGTGPAAFRRSCRGETAPT